MNIYIPSVVPPTEASDPATGRCDLFRRRGVGQGKSHARSLSGIYLSKPDGGSNFIFRLKQSCHEPRDETRLHSANQSTWKMPNTLAGHVQNTWYPPMSARGKSLYHERSSPSTLLVLTVCGHDTHRGYLSDTDSGQASRCSEHCRSPGFGYTSTSLLPPRKQMDQLTISQPHQTG